MECCILVISAPVFHISVFIHIIRCIKSIIIKIHSTVIIQVIVLPSVELCICNVFILFTGSTVSIIIDTVLLFESVGIQVSALVKRITHIRCITGSSSVSVKMHFVCNRFPLGIECYYTTICSS